MMFYYKRAEQLIQEAFGLERYVWDVEAIDGGTMVIICRVEDLTGTGRDFSVHTYFPETQALYSGDYDLTADEARETLRKRARTYSLAASRC